MMAKAKSKQEEVQENKVEENKVPENNLEENNSEDSVKEFEKRYEEGTLSASDLEGITIPEIHAYAKEHGLKFNTSSNKPELIEQVLMGEPNFDNVQGIKDLRKSFDRVIKLNDKLSLETDNVRDSLFLSRSWLGKMLHYFGEDNPYATKEPVKAASDIPATVDVVSDKEMVKELDEFRLIGHIEAIGILRSSIEELISRVDCVDFSSIDEDKKRHAAICRTQSWANALQAKFHLGSLLSKLRR